MTDKKDFNDVLDGYFTSILTTLIEKYKYKLILYLYLLRKDVLEKLIFFSYKTSIANLSIIILDIDKLFTNNIDSIKDDSIKFFYELLLKKKDEILAYRNEIVSKIILSINYEGYKDEKGNIRDINEIEPFFSLLLLLSQNESLTKYFVGNIKLYYHIFEILEKDIDDMNEKEQKLFNFFLNFLKNLFINLNKLKPTFNLTRDTISQKLNEIIDKKKENLKFIIYFISILTKILKVDFIENSNGKKCRLGRKIHNIMDLVHQVFIYMNNKSLITDPILIKTEFIKKSIEYFFKYQLNNIYHYKFIRFFKAYLDTEKDHPILRNYLFKDLKFHERIVDCINSTENVVQRPRKDNKTEENKDNKIINQEKKEVKEEKEEKENNKEKDNKEINQKDIEKNKDKEKIEEREINKELKDNKEKENIIEEKKDDKEEKKEKENIKEEKNNIKEEEKVQKEKDNIKEEKKEIKEDIKKEEKIEKENKVNENEEKNVEKINAEDDKDKNDKKEEIKTENKIDNNKLEESGRETKIKANEEITIENKKKPDEIQNENKIIEEKTEQRQENIKKEISNKKSSKKNLCLIYPFLIDLSYKIQTISGLKTFDENEQKSLGITNLSDFEFLKDELSFTGKLKLVTSKKLKEIIQASDKWTIIFEKKILPAIRRYESKLYKEKEIKKTKPIISNNNLLGLLTMLTDSLKAKESKLTLKNNKNEKNENKDGNQADKKNSGDENSTKKEKIDELNNKKYNDNNFWKVKTESLLNDKEMEDIINDL